MTDKEREEFLNVHLPYRMAHLDGLIWLAGGIPLENGVLRTPLAPIPEDQVMLLVNPMIDAGLLTCRVIADFLGIRLKKHNNVTSKGDISETKLDFDCPPKEDTDHHITKAPLNLQAVAKNEFDVENDKLSEDLELAFKETLFSAMKASAHLTKTDSSVSGRKNPALCANALLTLVENKVYKALSWPVPCYKHWTGN